MLSGLFLGCNVVCFDNSYSPSFGLCVLISVYVVYYSPVMGSRFPLSGRLMLGWLRGFFSVVLFQPLRLCGGVAFCLRLRAAWLCSCFLVVISCSVGEFCWTCVAALVWVLVCWFQFLVLVAFALVFAFLADLSAFPFAIPLWGVCLLVLLASFLWLSSGFVVCVCGCYRVNRLLLVQLLFFFPVGIAVVACLLICSCSWLFLSFFRRSVFSVLCSSAVLMVFPGRCFPFSAFWFFCRGGGFYRAGAFWRSVSGFARPLVVRVFLLRRGPLSCSFSFSSSCSSSFLTLCCISPPSLVFVFISFGSLCWSRSRCTSRHSCFACLPSVRRLPSFGGLLVFLCVLPCLVLFRMFCFFFLFLPCLYLSYACSMCFLFRVSCFIFSFFYFLRVCPHCWPLFTVSGCSFVVAPPRHSLLRLFVLTLVRVSALFSCP